jgi:hypothetical protein
MPFMSVITTSSPTWSALSITCCALAKLKFETSSRSAASS